MAISNENKGNEWVKGSNMSAEGNISGELNINKLQLRTIYYKLATKSATI